MISYAHASHQLMANWDSYSWLIFIFGGALIVILYSLANKDDD